MLRHKWQTLCLGGNLAEVQCQWGAAQSLGIAAGALCSAGLETAGWESGGWAWDNSMKPRPQNQCEWDSAGPAHCAWKTGRELCFNASVDDPYRLSIFKIKVDVVPEGQGKVCHKSIALSDQEGAVSPAALHAEVLNQALGHQPAFLHAAMKPGLWKLLCRAFWRPRRKQDVMNSF